MSAAEDQVIDANERWFVTSAEMCILLDITQQTLSRYVGIGLPQEGRNRFDLRRVVRYLRNPTPGAKDSAGNAAPSLVDAKRDLAVQQTLKVKTERLKLQGELVPIQEHNQIVFGLVQTMVTAFEELPGQCGMELAGISDPRDIEDHVRDIANSVRERLSERMLRGPETDDDPGSGDDESAAEEARGPVGGREKSAPRREPRSRQMANDQGSLF